MVNTPWFHGINTLAIHIVAQSILSNCQSYNKCRDAHDIVPTLNFLFVA